jgi:broad specificity phosphatase PhoE
MAGRIYLIHHAESVHNVTHDFSIHDPPLSSPVGVSQAENLGKIYPDHERVAIIVSSPLRRTIQTALVAFPQTLDKRYYDEGKGGVVGGAELVLWPDVQECSALPCDTGSDTSILSAEFPNSDFSTLSPGWNVKEGKYNAEEARAAKVRKYLYKRLKQLSEEEGERKDIVVVTHGVFMKHLSGDPTIDLPKAGWKRFRFAKLSRVDAGDVVLETDE